MGKTAVIIGAGPAGLTAAYKLAKERAESPVLSCITETGLISEVIAFFPKVNE